MDLFLCMAVLFALGSMMGWIIELFFRRFFSSHKWINPGFLVGPYVPLYGFGVVGLFLLSHYLTFDSWFNIPRWGNDIIVILIMGISMTLIEYIAGLIFIKGMGIKLWDYSNRKGNIQGIICPLFSLFWMIIGAAFHFLLTGVFENLLDWFTSTSVTNAWLPFLLGTFYGVIFVDFGYSLKITSRIRTFAKEHNIVVRFEEFKESIREAQVKAKEKFSFILPLKSSVPLKESLLAYWDKTKASISKKTSELKEKVNSKINKND